MHRRQISRKKDCMKFICIFISFCFLLLSSCEQLKNSQSVNKEDASPKEGNVGEIAETNETNKNLLATKEDSKIQDIKDLPPPLPPPLPPSIPSLSETPIQPEFSNELLKAVKNWTSIPKSVFPLPAVTILQPVKFTAKSKSGEIIAESTLPAGKEVVAVTASGQVLSVSPSKDSKLRGQIGMLNTDFKQGVAFLFETRKRQMELYKQQKLERQKLALQDSRSKEENVSSQRSLDSENSLFEDLPIPGDFGHGKFCICNDCRTKRLAATGSMK